MNHPIFKKIYILAKKKVKTHKFNPSEKLNDFNLVATALFEALQDADVEGGFRNIRGLY